MAQGYCSNCGAKLSPDAKFCGSCGSIVQIDLRAAEPSPSTDKTDDAHPTDARAGAWSDPQAPAKRRPGSGDDTRRKLIVGGGIVAALLLPILVLLSFSNSSSSSANQSHPIAPGASPSGATSNAASETSHVSPQTVTRDQAGAPQPTHAISVSRDVARITFPLPPARRYTWSSGGLTYGFVVEVGTGRNRYSLGFSLFTPMGASTEESGNLEEMLRAGQFDVARLGSNETFTVQHSNIEYRIIGGGTILEMTLRGQEIIDTIFGGRPGRARFIETIDFETRSIDGEVNYQN